MVRQLYRIYLYVVSLALLTFAAVGLYALLETALAFTSLRGSDRPIPANSELTQQFVFAGVAWLIAGLLGGVHYWLIRRDIAGDPAAGSGAVRAFFLNLAQAVAVVMTVMVGTGAFNTLAYRDTSAQYGYIPGTSGPIAGAIVLVLVAALLQFERSRTRAAPGLATTFQRLHLYGVGLGVLILGVAASWDSAMKTTLDAVLIQAKLYNPVTPGACGPNYKGPLPEVCALQDGRFLWLATLLPLAVVAVYALLARGDNQSILRTVAHLGSFGAGAAFVLVGLDRAVELGLRALFAIPVTWSEIAHPWNAPYNFVSPATFGVLALLIYGFWLRAEAPTLPLGKANTAPTMAALAGVILAAPFYWGLGRALGTAFEWFANSTAFAYPPAWAAALALMVTGVGYLLVTLRLRSRAATEPGSSVPQHALVLALLAGGIVSGAVGLAIVLYAWGTNILSAPLPDWERTARAGAAALVVGLVLAGIYGWIALRGHFVEPLMAGLGAAAQAPAEQTTAEGAMVEAIEGVLDQYATHTVDREHAAERILELTHPR